MEEENFKGLKDKHLVVSAFVHELVKTGSKKKEMTVNEYIKYLVSLEK